MGAGQSGVRSPLEQAKLMVKYFMEQEAHGEKNIGRGYNQQLSQQLAKEYL
jgi:hypothetical protein